ncbi:DUF2103 domain-containing protein [Halolamina sp.]|jgi:hypothetical protein|uniref:DUF2103 domain-containing protein n=1 Tax=Halolamina sp. TaxID=1940283 RepID=UPI000223B4DA|nr:Protein of unknown function DUF2103, metal-binding protein [halophilic archaeon DL31]
MDCRQCRSELDRPGDYCLACDTANCDAVVAAFERQRATLTFLRDPPEHAEDEAPEIVGETTVTTIPEADPEAEVVELRNFAGKVADEIRRKRPEGVYAAGAREPLRECRAQLHHQFYRVPEENPVEWVRSQRGEPSLEVVETPPKEKLGGSHSTLIGGRNGRNVVNTVAAHPNVKKLIPGPIEAGGGGSRGGVRAKATRAGQNGNVRLLIRDGSSVQENRVVTTARDRESGERIRADLNEALTEEGYREG